MKHPVDWSRQATLTRSASVNELGDGYRQISGTVVAEGSVAELVERVRAMSDADQRRHYINNDGGVPQTLAEIDADRDANEA